MSKFFYRTYLGLCLVIFLSLGSPKAATPEQVEEVLLHEKTLSTSYLEYPFGTQIAVGVKLAQKDEHRTLPQQYEEMARGLWKEVRNTCFGKYGKEIGKQGVHLYCDDEFNRCFMPQQRIFLETFAKGEKQFLRDYEETHKREPTLEDHLAYLKSTAEDLAKKHMVGEYPDVPQGQQAAKAEDSPQGSTSEEVDPFLLHLLSPRFFIERPFGTYIAAGIESAKSERCRMFPSQCSAMEKALNKEVLNTCLARYKDEIGKQGIELYADRRFRIRFFLEKRVVEGIFAKEARQFFKGYKETHGSYPSFDEHLAHLHSLAEDLARRQAAGEFTAVLHDKQAAPSEQQSAG